MAKLTVTARVEWDRTQISKFQAIAAEKLATAATATMRKAAVVAKENARATINMPGGWKNALRADVHPPKGNSLHPSVFVYDKISYAIAFEEGQTISGSPLLWIPLPSANIPRGPHGKQSTPADLANSGAELILLKGTSKPILAVVVRETDARALKPASGRLLRRGRNPQGRGTVRVIPMFVGVPRVTDPKRMDIRRAVADVADLLPAIFEAELAKLE